VNDAHKNETTLLRSVFTTYLHGDGIHQIRHAYFAHLLCIFWDLNENRGGARHKGKPLCRYANLE
jgi:hypothetical protein